MKRFMLTMLAAAAMVLATTAIGTAELIYLENYTTGGDDADAGWMQESSHGTGAARLESWAQSGIWAPETGINNNQDPAWDTQVGFFQSSGYTNWVYTSEYSFDVGTIAGWGMDAGSKRTFERDVYLMVEIDEVRYWTEPIAVIGDGSEFEWRQYDHYFDPTAATWFYQGEEGTETQDGLSGMTDAFGFTFYSGGDGNLYIDNYRIIPEPVTLGLLGLGGLAMLRRRRR